MSYPDLDPGSGEPEFDDAAQLREHRKRRLALGYRIFGAMRYGSLGDGHITARDRSARIISGSLGMAFRSGR